MRTCADCVGSAIRQQDERLIALGAAAAPLGEAPFRADRRAAEAVVRFVPRRRADPASTARAPRRSAASTARPSRPRALASDAILRGDVQRHALPRRHVFVFVTGTPAVRQVRDRRGRRRSPGFASSTNVVKNVPSRLPRGTSRRTARSRPRIRDPPSKCGVPKYIARSATPGCVNLTDDAEGPATSSRIAPAVTRRGATSAPAGTSSHDRRPFSQQLRAPSRAFGDRPRIREQHDR